MMMVPIVSPVVGRNRFIPNTVEQLLSQQRFPLAITVISRSHNSRTKGNAMHALWNIGQTTYSHIWLRCQCGATFAGTYKEAYQQFDSHQQNPREEME